MAEKKTKAKAVPKSKAKSGSKSKAQEAAASAKVSSKADDFRAKSADELADQLAKLKKEQFNLRFQRATGQNEGVGQVRQVRRDIARVKTIMAQKKTSSAAAK